MEKTLKQVGIVLMGLTLLGLLTYLASQQVLGSAPIGLPASPATSSTIAVGPNEVITIFENRNYCTSRVITSDNAQIKISFGSTTPTQNVGHIQNASTTIAYDSGIYGCGQWRVHGRASTTISIEEFN